jgi:hypothetical protein
LDSFYQSNNLSTIDIYLKNILQQILDSYNILTNLKNKPGDLEIIKKEISKITGQLHVVVKKLDSINNQSNQIVMLAKASKFFLDNYDFTNEIQALSILYANDPDRLKNLRLKILESLEDKKLLEKITQQLKDE